MGTELRLPGVPALGDARGTRGSLFRDSKRVPRPAALGLAGRLPGAPLSLAAAGGRPVFMVPVSIKCLEKNHLASSRPR